MEQEEEYRKYLHRKVPYRGENGESKVGNYTEVVPMFEKEQEDILKTIPSIKLKDLIAHFLSKEEFEKVQAIRALHQLEPTWEPHLADKVAIVSFARSGNTLNRAYMEKFTGIITGSGSGFTTLMGQDLFKNGLYGECLHDLRVWCIKTHYPEI